MLKKNTRFTRKHYITKTNWHTVKMLRKWLQCQPFVQLIHQSL